MKAKILENNCCISDISARGNACPEDQKVATLLQDLPPATESGTSHCFKGEYLWMNLNESNTINKC
jgi:hypothetical protein